MSEQGSGQGRKPEPILFGKFAKKDDFWRCPKGHESRSYAHQVEAYAFKAGGLSFSVGNKIWGPYCPDCLLEFLEAHIPKMVNEV